MLSPSEWDRPSASSRDATLTIHPQSDRQISWYTIVSLDEDIAPWNVEFRLPKGTPTRRSLNTRTCRFTSPPARFAFQQVNARIFVASVSAKWGPSQKTDIAIPIPRVATRGLAHSSPVITPSSVVEHVPDPLINRNSSHPRLKHVPQCEQRQPTRTSSVTTQPSNEPALRSRVQVEPLFFIPRRQLSAQKPICDITHSENSDAPLHHAFAALRTQLHVILVLSANIRAFERVRRLAHSAHRSPAHPSLPLIRPSNLDNSSNHRRLFRSRYSDAEIQIKGEEPKDPSYRETLYHAFIDDARHFRVPNRPHHRFVSYGFHML
ncbi:hypothetical protein FA15DRAFT_698137 [Coprinopsis marcescibilis]|uniref:Uncharacterized protein n=1 Tax=Coprinopsis marcescibilis TaxID=230819 RepID=A0A5C3KDR0_COPMA|nr:hypothetical protein FA15DRAFT_698137 [Coprinopsis marcescibilis]